MQGIRDLIVAIGELVKLAIPIVAGLALLGFFWGLALFIFQSGDEKKVDEGKRIMRWGLVALFVMVSVWGIIGFFQSDLGIDGGGVIQVQPI